MYEALVNRLRAECTLPYSAIKDMRDAADAIEKLRKELNAVNDAHNEGYDVGYWAGRRDYEPKWISVKELLPEEPYGCLAIVWDNNVMTGDTFLNYYPEYIGFDGESWNDCDGEEIPLEVVYWMKMPKIPEPPKEET